MADIFLIVSIVVAVCILLVVGVYFIVYYSHPDDHNDAYGPKAVVLMGFVLAGGTVLLLPLDVANNGNYAGCAGYDTALCGGLNMELFWNMIFWLLPIWVFFIIPFTTFYYEADDGMLMAGTSYAPDAMKKSRCAQAAVYQVFVTIIVSLIFLVLYLLFAKTNIPVQQFVGNGTTGVGIGIKSLTSAGVYTISATDYFHAGLLENMNGNDAEWIATVVDAGPVDIELSVDVSTFFAGFMAWFGWFLFAIFGGIGLSGLPLDLIMAYVNRPKHMDAVEFAEAQMSLRDRVNELVDIGELIKIEREEKAQAGLQSKFGTWSMDKEVRKAAADERQAILGFKQAVFLLEEDVEDFMAVAENYEHYNPLLPYISLFMGCVSVIISIFWFIQIIVYCFPNPPLAPFLNAYFAWFDSWFPLFGVLSVALFTVYLLFCALKGCFKFGLRFLFFHIHPMKPGKTYMSSFLFNTGLVLLCCMPVVQFCQEAFADYAATSNIRQIFGTQITNLKFFGWFWRNDVFLYAYVIIAVLTGFYLYCQPKDQATQGQALRDRLRSRKAGGEGGGSGEQ